MSSSHQQILAHGEIGKNTAPLGNVGNAEARDAKRRRSGARGAMDVYRSRARKHVPEQGTAGLASGAAELGEAADATFRRHAGYDIL
jgi:hypothetical protein